MLRWLRGIFVSRKRAQQRLQRIVRDMGGLPPRHLMLVDAAPESSSPNQTRDSRESRSLHEGMLARRHFSR